MTFEMLADRGLYSFDEATQVIDASLDESRALQFVGTSSVWTVRELMHLNAAELALLPGLSTATMPDLPVQVPSDTARVAVLVTDCNPFWTHSPEMDPQVWDVVLFGGDVSKVAAVLGTTEFGALRERFDEFIDDYERALQGTELRHANQLVQAGLGQLRALLWRTKLGVLARDPGLEGEIAARIDQLFPGDKARV